MSPRTTPTPLSSRPRSALAALALGALLGCDDGPADATPDTAGPDTAADATAPDTAEVLAPDMTGTTDTTDAADVTPGLDRFEVGPHACCLAMEGDLLVWSEDGDLWRLDAATGEKQALVTAPGLQINPALSNGRLVWSDARDGDLDLWTMTLDASGRPTSEPALLRGGPGDQDQAALDGARLVWIGRDLAPHTAREAEVWTMDLTAPATERQLTNDAFEQTQPDVSGDRIVWADFAHSPDAIYIDIADPLRNNADIFGHDLATDTGFIVTDDLSKQLRPAIDGDDVTWLDWRGINPEPKYSEFQVYARRIATAPGTTHGPERRLAWSSWSRPELWRRPAIADGVVVFIAEPNSPGTGFLTGLLAVRVDAGNPWLVTGAPSVLDSVVVRDGHVAFVGAGTLGRVALEPR